MPFNPFKGRQPGRNGNNAASSSPQSNLQQSSPNTGPLASGTTTPQAIQGGEINLVNYTPEQLMQHVDATLSNVHFGMSKSATFMEFVAEVWAVAGPPTLLAGTAGEVFAFIWMFTSDTAWWVGLSVLATIVVLEATFMVVSYKSSTIRNRAETRPEGPSSRETTKMKRYKGMWFTLAFGVGGGQVAFLVAALNAKLGNLIWLVLFVVIRTIMTLASDYYTAFVHEEKPTEGEEAKNMQEQRATLASELLEQKGREVSIINKGILSLQEAHTEAEMKQDTLKADLEVKKLENKSRVDAIRSVQEQSSMFNALGHNIIRAIFDPELPDDQRQKLLGTMQALMDAGKHLPSPRVIHIKEEEEDV